MPRMQYVCLYSEYLETMKLLSDEELGRLVRGMLAYNNSECEPDLQGNERFLWLTVKAKMDRDTAAYLEKCKRLKKNGEQGGRPRKNQVDDEKTKWFLEEPKKANRNRNRNRNQNQNIKSRVCGVESGDSPPPARHQYGEYKNVLLSDGDIEKLKNEFPSDWEQRIERLSEYMAISGKTYKNHLATIRKWARSDAKEQAQNGTIANSEIRFIECTV